MPRPAATSVFVWLALLVALAACVPPSHPPPSSSAEPGRVSEIAVAPPSAAQEVAGGEAPAQEVALAEGEGPIPVGRADPIRGSVAAPVTWVVFSDFECPFCKRLSPTIGALLERYGRDQLRVVWKNNPLPFHKEARPTAEAAMAVFAHHGPDAFWAYHDAIFGAQDRLTPALQDLALRRAGVSANALPRLLANGAAARKVDADMALAKDLGATGTPASFINGVFVSGAQPMEKFAEVIDAQLALARSLRAQGTPPGQIYAAAVQKSFSPPEKRAPPAGARANADPDADDTKIHRVPVGDSPVRGKSTALVTLVMFSDFQCPFCAKVEPTIEQLVTQYGDKLRVVWKDNPLPFHNRAEPAAQLAREARAQKGDAAFWKAHDLLFQSQRALEDPDLERIAAQIGLNVDAVKRAVASHKHAAKIEDDQGLADDLDAGGTPTFFINGRRLVGAQPVDKFQQIIAEEIAKAEALVAKGTPRAKVYDALQKQATPPAGPPKVKVPAPGKWNPGKGAANGKVVVQVFSDFQCPFCKRSVDTMKDLLAAFPGQVRVVWRNQPLPMHPEAQGAAEAALEAFAQKGEAGFWKMHDLLFQDTSAQNLDRAALERHAAAVGLDLAKFRAALDGGVHRAAIDADKKVAEGAGISGTPAFVINGYLVSGAQPLAKLKKVVRRALAEK